MKRNVTYFLDSEMTRKNTKIKLEKSSLAVIEINSRDAEAPSMDDIFHFAQKMIASDQIMARQDSTTNFAARIASLDSFRKSNGVSLLKIKSINCDAEEESEIVSDEPIQLSTVKKKQQLKKGRD